MVDMYSASVDGVVIARSDETVTVEGNQYFPLDSVLPDVLMRAKAKSLCPWKGVASYYTVSINGLEHHNAAWEYRHPSRFVRRIKHHVAFWGPIRVSHES